jgi:hypothetical protein
MIIEAIHALGVSEFVCDAYSTKESFERTYKSLSESNPTITWEQVNSEIIRLEKEFSDNEYARNRASAYDSIGNQLDMIYKDNLNGTTTHKDSVEAVKAKYPKPS